MSSLYLKFILTSVLLVAQTQTSIAVPAFGQCAAGQCCCSSEAKQWGTCSCSVRTTSGTCCHSAESRSIGRSHDCQCGCQDDSRPIAPNPRPSDSREQQLRIASQPAALSSLCPIVANGGPESDPNRHPHSFYSGVSQQPLFCAWLL